MSDGVFGVLGGMALADLDRANSQTALHNEEMAGMMEYQGNVASATLEVARSTRDWAVAIHKVAEVGFKQGKNNMDAIVRNRSVIQEVGQATKGAVDGVRAVADETKAVLDNTLNGVRATFKNSDNILANTQNLLALVGGMHETQVQMIDVMERMAKRDEALEKEVHELRDLVARSNCPSPD